jgi:hypothetical protein
VASSSRTKLIECSRSAVSLSTLSCSSGEVNEVPLCLHRVRTQRDEVEMAATLTTPRADYVGLVAAGDIPGVVTKIAPKRVELVACPAARS